MNINDCYNFEDFRKLAKKKLPAPIFHYIDGGADDEVTLNRNTEAFNDCDLVPNILNSVGEPDLSTTVFGRKISMPLFLSPTAMQSLYDPEGDKASARAAEKFDTIYSMSTMASFSIEEIANISSGPKLFQLYIHDYYFLNLKLFLFKSLILVQPINFISRTNSDLYFSKALSTPACPAAAKAYKYSLPPEHAFAPNDNAFSI